MINKITSKITSKIISKITSKIINEKEGDHIRKERIWYPGATYHAMARGIRRMVIFQDDTDYQVFLMLLKKMVEKHNCSLHAYCLMTNHFHLLIETEKEEIGKTVKGITSCYAAYYNQKYGYHGHVAYSQV